MKEKLKRKRCRWNTPLPLTRQNFLRHHTVDNFPLWMLGIFRIGILTFPIHSKLTIWESESWKKRTIFWPCSDTFFATQKSKINVNIGWWSSTLHKVSWDSRGNFFQFVCLLPAKTEGSFIYILDSSNSTSIKFWTCQYGSSSRSSWTASETVTQMAVELINIHLISVQQKR